MTAEVSSAQPANADGWYRTPATITYTCAGGTAPVVCPAPVTRESTAPGRVFNVKVTDAAGQVARVQTPLQVDIRAPRVAYTRTRTRTGTYPWPRDAQPITCTATDIGSGLNGDCTVTYSDISVDSRGRSGRTWTATATDVAGNTTTVSRSFGVAAS